MRSEAVDGYNKNPEVCSLNTTQDKTLVDPYVPGRRLRIALLVLQCAVIVVVGFYVWSGYQSQGVRGARHAILLGGLAIGILVVISNVTWLLARRRHKSPPESDHNK